MESITNRIKILNKKIDERAEKNGMLTFKKWLKENKKNFRTREYATLRKYYNREIQEKCGSAAI